MDIHHQRHHTPPARFEVFQGDKTWVLRDNLAGTDHPCLTKLGALAAADIRRQNPAHPFLGAPSSHAAYGVPVSTVAFE